MKYTLAIISVVKTNVNIFQLFNFVTANKARTRSTMRKGKYISVIGLLLSF